MYEILVYTSDFVCMFCVFCILQKKSYCVKRKECLILIKQFNSPLVTLKKTLQKDVLCPNMPCDP